MADAYIVDGVRTAMGKKKGTLSHVFPVDLVPPLLNALVERNGIDPVAVEDVILGCVTPVGEQGWNIARMAVLAAGWPVEVPGVQLNRMCSSGQQAANFAAQAVMAGVHDLIVAGGVESMSRVPMGTDGGPLARGVTDRFTIVPQGISAEMIADRWGFTREQLDQFSLESHRKAARAIDAGHFKAEIVPLEVKLPEGETVRFDTDETVRRDTSLEKMATLVPAFKPDGKVTAGNSSQITDGASVLLIASEKALKEHNLKPRARFVAMALSGVDPTIMLTGPIPATRKVLQKAGLGLDDMDVIEVNEAFASVVLAWLAELRPADPARLNPNGGAIALGHPLGATGARLLTSLVGELERRKGRYGLQTMCVGFGMGIATIIERIDG